MRGLGPATHALLIASTLLAACATPAAARQSHTLVAIVNRQRPEKGIDSKELVQIFRGDIRRWPSNRQLIQLALPPGSPEMRNEFIRKVLQMTPLDFDREWRGKRLRGESAMIPNPDLTRTEVMQAVATQKHFIAVVDLEWLRSIDTRFTQDVKILEIDGKRPDQDGYPLRIGWLNADRAGLATRFAAAITTF